MRMPQALEVLIREKFGRDLGWWAREYEAAVERIQDHTADPENPYYHAPGDESDAYNDDNGPHIFDVFGGESTIEETRQRAWELLVLCDLAPLTPKPQPEIKP